MSVKFLKKLLFPPPAVAVSLVPVSGGLLAYAMTHWAETSPLRIGSYVLAFYTLTLWCVRLPGTIRFWKGFSRENPHVRRWLTDRRLRLNVTLTGNVLWNGAYAALQLGLGWYHRSFWFGFLGVYYLCLTLTRIILVGYSRRHALGQDLPAELGRYRLCGWVLLILNLALTVRIFLMLRDHRLVAHHQITTIAMAAYTFTSLTMAGVNLFRYRKYRSPVLSASKAISLASALVSLLSLEGTMLVSFGDGTMTRGTELLFLSLTGGGVSAIIVAMAIYMLRNANNQRKARKLEYGPQ